MDDPTQALLFLNSVPHRLQMVLQNAKLAPAVAIKVSAINVAFANAPAETRVEHKPETAEALDREVVFFKQNGAYTVLAGRRKVDGQITAGATEIQGRLLSTPMLKKCRIEKETRASQEAVQPLLQDIERDRRTGYQDRTYQGNRLEIPRRSNQYGRE